MIVFVVAGLILFLIFGAPLFAILLGASSYGAFGTSTADTHRTFWNDFALQVQDVLSMATGEQASVLSTIPLFIFAGYLMAEAKAADRLVAVARAGLGWLPGGLAIVTIVACALFTTFTGASGVTIVALGGLLLPALLRENYSERFALGLVGGTGSVGLLFPPAVPLIVYGTVYGYNAQAVASSESEGATLTLIDFTADRFLFAGIVPGLVLVCILCLYAMLVAARSRVPRQPFDGPGLWRGLAHALPELIVPVLVILGLRLGLDLPDVAALTVTYILIIEIAWYRDLSLRSVWPIVRESMVLVGAIFIIIFAAVAFTNFLTTAQVPETVFHWVMDRLDSPWMFLLALNGVLLLVGMTMDIFSAIVVIVPLIIRPAQAFGIDPFHLGVIFLLNLEIGYLTPPVGLNLFITGFAFKKPILTVTRATMPFLACMLAALVLVTYIPALTVVPPKQRRGPVRTLIDDVRAARTWAMSVTEVELAPGRVLRLKDCADIADSLNREFCETLFVDITRCRNGAESANCEKSAITEYLELTSDEEDDDWEQPPSDPEPGTMDTDANKHESDIRPP